jgi:hypothetical protein
MEAGAGELLEKVRALGAAEADDLTGVALLLQAKDLLEADICGRLSRVHASGSGRRWRRGEHGAVVAHPWWALCPRGRGAAEARSPGDELPRLC